MIETDNRIPVPEPITPTKSEKIDIKPIIIPPQAAATGIRLFNWLRIYESGKPLIVIPSSFIFLAISLGDYLVTSSQNLEKNAQLAITKTVYTIECNGSVIKVRRSRGGEIQ